MNAVGPKLLSGLLREHGAALVLYARQWCQTPEDVVQEAFLQLVQQSEPLGNTVAWLYRVVRNGAISAARSAHRRRRHESAASHQGEPWFDSGHDDRIDADAVTEALRQLPQAEAETIVARLWGGLSFDAIAELTGDSRTTVFRRYQAGLEVLRERFGVTCHRQENRMKT